MSKHLQNDLDRLKRDILEVGSVVEEATNRAAVALVDRRIELVQEVYNVDDDIDQREVAIEENCLKILALHQPVAADLRFVITVLKVNNDLERMGDLAVNIAQRAEFLAQKPPIGVPFDFHKMVTTVRDMVHDALQALVLQDVDLAGRVLAADDVVDDVHREMYSTLQEVMKADADTVERATHTLSASRHLERIADLATNIAEDVIFMVEGEVVRHRHHAG